MSAIRGISGIEGPREAWSLEGTGGPIAAEGGRAAGPLGQAEGALGPTSTPGSVGGLSEPSGATGVSFGDVLGGLVGQAAARGQAAAHKAEALASGAEDDLHGTMIAAKEAEISLKLVGTIRTKLVEAFHELWRTGV
jgi:flagellar hook-basal body complex protein FliE